MEPNHLDTLHVETLRATHATELYPFLQAPALYHYIPGPPPSRVEEVETRFASLEAGSTKPDQIWLNWVARVDGTPVATLQSTLLERGHALVGYVVFEPFWNRGIGTLCVAWILRELFERHLVQTARAQIDPRNSASLRIVQKLGMSEIVPSVPLDALTDRQFEIHHTEWVSRNDPG